MPFENLIDQKAILRRRDLSSTEKLVALVALSFRNASSGRCDPPVESDDLNVDTLCSLSGFSRPCVNKALASLEAKGVIKRTARTARPSQIYFILDTRNVVTRNDVTPNVVTRNDVTSYPKPSYGLPVTTLPQTDKYREEQISSVAPACDSAACPTVDEFAADVFGPDPDISNPPAELPPAKEKEKPAKKKRGYRCEVERPADVDPQLWADFIKNRQTKKCPVTQTLLRRYAEKGKLCGMSLSQVLTTIIERNWQGFEPAWLQKEQEGRACFKATPERTAAPSYFSVTKPVPQPVDDDGAHELFKGLLA